MYFQEIVVVRGKCIHRARVYHRTGVRAWVRCICVAWYKVICFYCLWLAYVHEITVWIICKCKNIDLLPCKTRVTSVYEHFCQTFLNGQIVKRGWIIAFDHQGVICFSETRRQYGHNRTCFPETNFSLHDYIGIFLCLYGNFWQKIVFASVVCVRMSAFLCIPVFFGKKNPFHLLLSGMIIKWLIAPKI